jgi:hypothetical protein
MEAVIIEHMEAGKYIIETSCVDFGSLRTQSTLSLRPHIGISGTPGRGGYFVLDLKS